MKRFATVILTIVLAFSMISASAAVPGFMTESYNNYTADYSFTLSFESSDEIVALLEELEMPREVNNFVDLKSLLEGILSQESLMNLQINMSDDFRKGEYALTSDTSMSVDANKNINVSVKTKSGMWLRFDLDAEQPVFEIVYTNPAFNKYVVVDLFEAVADETEKAQMTMYLDSVFNADFINEIGDYSLEVFEKYADIKMTGATCTVKIDNEALIAMIGELAPVVAAKMQNIMADVYSIPEADEAAEEAESVAIIGGADGPTDVVVAQEEESEFIPDIEGLQILGEEGITYKYSLLSGKISTAEMKADVSFDISKFFTEVVGEEWEYENKGILDFVAKANVKLTNIGTTEVQFPELTEENSVNAEDLYPSYDTSYTEDPDYVPYPRYSAYAYCEYVPVGDEGEIYVPLRAVMESAYEEEVSFEYDRGVIIARSDYFPGFKMLKLIDNGTVAYTDGATYQVPTVIVENGTTYVSSKVLEEILGWTLHSADYDLMYDEYYFYFFTGRDW